MQRGKVIAYESKQLEILKIYTSHDLELAAFVSAVKLWRHYNLYGTTCTQCNGSKSLQYMFIQKDLNIIQGRCMEVSKDFDYEILYHPSKANLVKHDLIFQISFELCLKQLTELFYIYMFSIGKNKESFDIFLLQRRWME